MFRFAIFRGKLCSALLEPKCRILQFYEFYFTFHDFFVPLVLILLSTYVSVKYPGATVQLRSKKTIYVALFAICLLFSVFLSIPATLKAAIFIDDPPGMLLYMTNPTNRKCNINAKASRINEDLKSI